MLGSCKMLQKQPEAFHTSLWHFFPSLKQNFIAYRSSKVSDCIFEIYQLWQSGFSRVYSSCCGSCSFEPEIIKIGQSSHNMYSNNIMNFQESTTILNACTKKVWKLIEYTTYVVGIYWPVPFWSLVSILPMLGFIWKNWLCILLLQFCSHFLWKNMLI